MATLVSALAAKTMGDSEDVIRFEKGNAIDTRQEWFLLSHAEYTQVPIWTSPIGFGGK